MTAPSPISPPPAWRRSLAGTHAGKDRQTVNLKLDTESFKKDHPVQTLRYIPVNTENKSLSWRAETGWLWFRIEQTPIVDSDPDKNLKTDLGNRDLTRLFTGETTVVVTNQRVGSLAVTKNVEADASDRPDPDASYRVTVTLSRNGKPHQRCSRLRRFRARAAKRSV